MQMITPPRLQLNRSTDAFTSMRRWTTGQFAVGTQHNLGSFLLGGLGKEVACIGALNLGTLFYRARTLPHQLECYLNPTWLGSVDAAIRCLVGQAKA